MSEEPEHRTFTHHVGGTPIAECTCGWRSDPAPGGIATARAAADQHEREHQ